MSEEYVVQIKAHSPHMWYNGMNLFYAEELPEAAKFLKHYVKVNGFTVKGKRGTETIADVKLIKKTLTGEVLKEWSALEVENGEAQE